MSDPQPIGQLLDSLGVTSTIAPDDLPVSALVLLGAACQRLTETEAALVEVTGERDRARDLAVRLWDEGSGTGDAVPGLGIVQIRPSGQNAGAGVSPPEIAREARKRCCAGDGLPEAGGVCETHAQETPCG